jgi:hypothetical protein
VPAALIGDAMNVLSQQWEAPGSGVPNDQKTTTDLGTSNARAAASTTIYAALASRVDNTNMATTGYNGGLESFPRFHEDWSGNTFHLSRLVRLAGNAAPRQRSLDRRRRLLQHVQSAGA